jgi:sulfane dehydrogenase subunit SoxC
MASEQRPERHEEIEAILARKPGAVETRDEANRYTVVGAAERGTYTDWLTPIADHFVCHRNPIPEADAADWDVSIAGPDGERTVSVPTLREAYPTVAIAHTMECAGNGRGQHDPETGSVQWGFEAVGTAIWTGTPLRAVLREQGIETSEGRWLTAIGGDSLPEETFARSIPLDKALDDCILAYGMNGEALPPEHGFPVRLIVPGWYGVNNVKWVEQLRVERGMVTEGSLDRPGTHARWQQTDYRLHPEGVTPTEHEQIEEVDTETQLYDEGVEQPYTFDETVMSVIGAPDGTDPIDSGGAPIEVVGVAWAGDDTVERVEVSVDGGASWADADLFGPDYAGTWRLFSYEWTPDTGEYTLCSRATDDRGYTQPASISSPGELSDAIAAGEFPYNEGGYAANAYLPNGLTVTVHEQASNT